MKDGMRRALLAVLLNMHHLVLAGSAALTAEVPIGNTQNTVIDPSPGFVGLPLAPPHSEGRQFDRHRACPTFRGHRMMCGVERDEWNMVAAVVTPQHTVLELGARFGTTSCALAQATNNSGRVVSVEPDPSVHAALLANRASHSCNFHIVRGTVGSTPLALGSTFGGYDQKTRKPKPGKTEVMVPNVGVAELERRVGGSFDVLLIDCEGCINELPMDQLLPHAVLVLLEMDSPNRVNYAEWHVLLTSLGFQRVWHMLDSFFSGNQPPHHALWQRIDPARPELVSCEDYARRTNESLRCIDPGLRAGSREKSRVQRGHRRLPELLRKRGLTAQTIMQGRLRSGPAG